MSEVDVHFTHSFAVSSANGSHSFRQKGRIQMERDVSADPL